MKTPAIRLALAILTAAGMQASDKTFGAGDTPRALAQVERASRAAARGPDTGASVTVTRGVLGRQAGKLPTRVDSRGR